MAALLLHPACVASPSRPHPHPHRGAGAHPEPPGPSPPASLLSVVCGRAPLLRTAPRTLLSCLRAQSPGEAPPQLAAGALRETLTGRDGGRDFSGASSAVSPLIPGRSLQSQRWTSSPRAPLPHVAWAGQVFSKCLLAWDAWEDSRAPAGLAAGSGAGGQLEMGQRSPRAGGEVPGRLAAPAASC